MLGIRKALAAKYDPSIMGALGFLGGFVIMGGIAGAAVAAVVGAGVAVVAGAAAATGAIWGAGIVGGAAVALIAVNAVPPLVYQWAYKQELKAHVRNGGSTAGHWYVPGIENIKPGNSLRERLSKVFNRREKKTALKPPAPKQTPPAP